MRRSINLLARRIAELDKVPYIGGVAPDGDTRNLPLAHFVWVMQSATEPFMKFEAGKGAVIDPAMADEMVKDSRLLNTIAEYDASLTAGPLRADRQHWIYIADGDEVPDSVSTRPYQECFAMPSAAIEQAPAIKPQSIGLYTSTATSVGRSMWREYLEGFRRSTLFPLPWYIWELQLQSHDVDIIEITNASKWVQFIEAYPLLRGAHVYPDWARIACGFDAVHITLPAIAAMQGFYFATPVGSILPAFWDVETTFWLKWCFTGARLRETVDAQ
jgi:hypothetical protein